MVRLRSSPVETLTVFEDIAHRGPPRPSTFHEAPRPARSPRTIRLATLAAVIANDTVGRSGQTRWHSSNSSGFLMNLRQWFLIGWLVAGSATCGLGQSIVGSDTYRRIK